MLKTKNKRFVWIVGYVLVLVAAFVYLKADQTMGVTLNEAYKQDIRSALAEIDVASSNNLSEISAATDNLSNFMNYRAGVQLSPQNKNLLNAAEQNFWADSKTIDPATLAQAITEIAVQQLPSLSNSQIAEISESFCRFNAPGLPPNIALGRNRVTLRADGRGSMLKTGFSSELTSLRDSGGGKAAETMIYLAVKDEVERKAKLLKDAEPTLFAGSDLDMSPIVATLVTYSVVTDDQLLHNQAGLANAMAQRQIALQNALGVSYPSPSGYRAYGANGYIFSSPANIVPSDANLSSLINAINAKRN